MLKIKNLKTLNKKSTKFHKKKKEYRKNLKCKEKRAFKLFIKKIFLLQNFVELIGWFNFFKIFYINK